MQPIYREHELAFRTQYAELKERTRAAGPLLPGTPGTLVKRSGTGYGYWYRVFYPAPGKVTEEIVCKDGDEEALTTMRERMAFSAWASKQVAALRKLGFQVADKATARVLVELHNRELFDAGLVLVGTLGYMAWLNELGTVATAARTRDIDLARRQTLRLAAPSSFLETMHATGLPFVSVPGLPSTAPSTSVKLTGVDGLRVDVLVPGKTLGKIVKVRELDWSAQAIPHYDYLLENPEPGAMLAGNQCIPVRLPQAARFFWHKLYSATQRHGMPEKAAKDRQQALVIGASLANIDELAIKQAFEDAPPALLKPIKSRPRLLNEAAQAHPLLHSILADCFAQ